MSDDDPQLLLGVRQGDEGVWNQIFDQYNRPLCQFIGFLSIVNREDVHDIANETWEKAWKAKSRIHSASNIKAWLFEIAKNKATDHSRKRIRRENSMPSQKLNAEHNGGIGVEIADPEALEDQVEKGVILGEAWNKTIEKTTPKQRNCYILHEQGRTFEEISLELDLRVGTVEPYVCTVRKIFRGEYRKLQEGD